MPQTGPMARARWSVLLAGSPRLHTAFSLESVADELCFVVGPAAVTLLATQVHPAAGVTCAALCALGGSLWFASQRSTEPPVVAAPVASGPTGAGRARLPACPAVPLVSPRPAWSCWCPCTCSWARCSSRSTCRRWRSRPRAGTRPLPGSSSAPTRSAAGSAGSGTVTDLAAPACGGWRSR